ncbi:hypothetical protein AB0D24_36425 [Streptomyces javensis]
MTWAQHTYALSEPAPQSGLHTHDSTSRVLLPQVHATVPSN